MRERETEEDAPIHPAGLDPCSRSRLVSSLSAHFVPMHQRQDFPLMKIRPCVAGRHPPALSHRNVIGHGVQPAGERAAPIQEAGPAYEHEEGGLEGVLGSMSILQHSPADIQYHRSVPLHQQGECLLIVPGGKALQQRTVGQLATLVRGQQLTELMQELAECSPCHALSSPGRFVCLITGAATADKFLFFSPGGEFHCLRLSIPIVDAAS